MVGIRTMARRGQYSMSSPTYTTLSYTYTVSYYRHRPTYPAYPLRLPSPVLKSASAYRGQGGGESNGGFVKVPGKGVTLRHAHAGMAHGAPERRPSGGGRGDAMNEGAAGGDA